MCGFAGFLTLAAAGGLAAGAALPDTSAHLALNSIARRGPDSEGQWHDSHIWLGHRRLSIVDLDERGTQPMERANLVIAFNGMIYNYREIKEQLKDKGFQFTTDTDTEVIAAGWAQWGEGLPERLQGMFAFALWDKKEKTLFLVRDRLGKKPLYYRHWQGGLAFGSRFDTVEALTAPAQLSKDALSWLLTLKYIPDPFSAADEVHKVPAGHLLKIREGRPERKCWYEPLPDDALLSVSPERQKQRLRDLIEQSVAERLISDVPLACFLSGGIDSAIIAALAHRIKPIDTFTAGFDDPLFDESEEAARTARHLGTSHHRLRLRADKQLHLIDQLFTTALDEPFGDSSALPFLFVSRAMKNYATVALSGDGADELFGGYRKYQGELVADLWQRIPTPFRKLLRGTVRKLPRGRDTAISDRLRQLDKFISGVELPDAERHAYWMALAPGASDIQQLLGPGGHTALVRLLGTIAVPNNLDRYTITLLRDIRTVLISDMLVKIDRTSMDTALEVRSPFLDHRVLEASLAIGGRQKIAWGHGKKILRDIFRAELPAELFSARKRGFEIPLNRWLSGPLKDKLSEAVSPDFLVYNNLDPRLGTVIKSGIIKGLYPHAEMGWTLMSVFHWQKARGFK